MNEIINEPVSVILIYNAREQTVRPAKMLWRGREYLITKLGYHHKMKQGSSLLHIFSVATETTAFKLRMNTETLHWILEELYDTSSHQSP